MQTLVLVGFGGMLVAVVVLMAQIQAMGDRLELIDTIGDNNSKVIGEMSVAKSYLTDFGSDLNQIREYLLLPTSEYDFGALGDVDFEEAEEDLTTLVFQLVSRLADYEESEAVYEENLVAVKELFADGMWTEAGLRVDGFTVYDDSLSGMEVLDLDLDLTGEFTLTGYFGEVSMEDAEDFAELVAELREFIAGVAEFRALVALVNERRVGFTSSIFVESYFLSLLEVGGMTLGDEQEADEMYYWELKNADGTVLAQIGVWKETAEQVMRQPGENGGDSSDWGVDVFHVESLNTIDARTALEKMVDENTDELADLMADLAFVATLEDAGFTVGEVVEDDAGISYPILDGDGAILRTLYLNKSTGEVRVLDVDGESEDLASAIDALDMTSKKKLWICLAPFRPILRS